MKIYIIISLFLFSFYTTYGQLPPADIAQSYEFEVERFNDNIQFYNDQFLNGYNDFYPLLAIKTLRVMESERNYDPLVPIEFKFFMKIADRVVPGSEKVSKVFTGLLEKGWTAHNNEIEANRKKGLIDEQITSYLKNITDKDDFDYTMGPFLKRGSLKSDFNKNIDEMFYRSNKIEAEQIWEELNEINERLEKHPIFSNRDSNAKFAAIKKFYEDYMMQFANILNNDTYDTAGCLYAYLDMSSGFKIKNKIIVPDVPAGWEIGQRLNSTFSKSGKKPLDLKVYKVLFIHSIIYRGLKEEKSHWRLTLDSDNYVKRAMIREKHENLFLNEYGKFDEQKRQWQIPESLFSEFTSKIPEGMNKIPDSKREMIEL